MDTRFVLGGVAFDVPPLSIFALKKCWGAISIIGRTNDALMSADAMLEVVAAGMSVKDNAPTAEDLSKLCTPGDWDVLGETMQKLFEASGMKKAESPKPGEAETSLSTETGTA